MKKHAKEREKEKKCNSAIVYFSVQYYFIHPHNKQNNFFFSIVHKTQKQSNFLYFEIPFLSFLYYTFLFIISRLNYLYNSKNGWNSAEGSMFTVLLGFIWWPVPYRQKLCQKLLTMNAFDVKEIRNRKNIARKLPIRTRRDGEQCCPHTERKDIISKETIYHK